MANLPANLPALLREAGLTVIEVDGWRYRGRPGSFAPVGVLNHHTGASARGWSRAKRLAYAKWMFLTGRGVELPAPLCQLALGPEGEVYIGAAGRANHGGEARASGSVSSGDANTLYIGIEWMLSGSEKIPAEMREAGVVLNAVLTEKITKTSTQTISCHYQTSVTGKWDIGDPDGVDYKGHKVLDVAKFRRDVDLERERLYRPAKEKGRSLRAAVVNVPVKVGRAAWEQCFTLAARSAIFGLNESVSTEQRETYRSLMDESSEPLRQFGLWRGPNPVFWRSERFVKVSGNIIEIHGPSTGPLASKYPGYNEARYVTEVVLKQKTDGREFAVLNTHLVPNGPRVAAVWRTWARRRSLKVLRQLVAKHVAAGRSVILMGDMNIKEPFAIARPFRWYRGEGIDKIGGTLSGAAKTFPAPTDHKRGVVATVVIPKEK